MSIVNCPHHSSMQANLFVCLFGVYGSFIKLFLLPIFFSNEKWSQRTTELLKIEIVISFCVEIRLCFNVRCKGFSFYKRNTIYKGDIQLQFSIDVHYRERTMATTGFSCQWLFVWGNEKLNLVPIGKVSIGGGWQTNR